MHKKIIIRCDAAESPIIGTGHLYRSILIYKYLKKKLNLYNKEILLIVKNKDKFTISDKILKSEKIKFLPINTKIKDYSNQEINYINKFTSNLLIIDRWGSINKNSINMLKKKHKKIILIDDGSKFKKLVNLSLNPLKLNNKKTKNNFSGHNYNILPSFFHKKKNNKNIRKSIFIFFGGYDRKKLTSFILKKLSTISVEFTLIIHEKYKKITKNLKNKIQFYNNKGHYKKLQKSDIVICSGGLSMFDAIFFNKFTICFPQYKHQSVNINILSKKKVVEKLNKRKIKNLKNIIYSYYENNDKIKELQKRQKKIINERSIQKTLNLIRKCYEKRY